VDSKGGLVFCISCKQLMEPESDSFVFKTGFYMREYPLAQCSCCRQLQEKKDMAS
jgi:hypothetical protein